MARVIVSSGHTQDEPGAVRGDLREVDVARKIASAVTKKLRDQGIITLIIPPDLGLDKRVEWINTLGYSEESGDICIEIHINEGTDKSGIEGWYSQEGENLSQELTEILVEETSKKINKPNLGAKSEATHPLKNLPFLSKTEPTASILDCLSFDNPADIEFLKNDANIELLAEGIVDGFLVFFGQGADEQTDTADDTDDFDDIDDFDDFDKPVQTPQPIKPTFQTPTFPSYNAPSPYTPQSFNTPSFKLADPNAQTKTREERKKMIEEMYEKYLGKKITDQDLNYFLNLGLDENQMLKRIVESQEHSDMIKNSTEYNKIKPEYDSLKLAFERLRIETDDKTKLLDEQNQMIQKKNQVLQSYQQQPVASIQQPIPIKKPEKKPQGFIDKILSKLDNLFD